MRHGKLVRLFECSSNFLYALFVARSDGASLHGRDQYKQTLFNEKVAAVPNYVDMNISASVHLQSINEPCSDILGSLAVGQSILTYRDRTISGTGCGLYQLDIF